MPISECHNWPGGTSGGRATIYLNRRNQHVARLVYEKFVGAIPAGMQINHHCDNKLCVNPKHLYAGTQLDNMRDRLRRGRYKNRPDMALCKKGEHEMVPENLYVDGEGRRRCRACRLASNRKSRRNRGGVYPYLRV